MKRSGSILYTTLAVICSAMPGQCGIVVEGFDNLTVLAGNGWTMTNTSDPAGVTNWFQGSSTAFVAQAGAPNAYIAANYNNTAAVGTISNWLITPQFFFANGDSLSFYTRTVAPSTFADRLEVRFSSNGASANVGSSSSSVGDFTQLLLTVNPTLSTPGYPEAWTPYNLQLTGLSGDVAGRLAFRYFVTNAGPAGRNSDYIGIDSVKLDIAAVPEPMTPLLVAAGIAVFAVRARRRRPVR